MKTWIISLFVNNHFGVLTRVTGLFSRRGYNIISLSVGETQDPEFSRITIQTGTDAAGIHQVMKQLQKLEDVNKVQLLPGGEDTVEKELMLVKLLAPEGSREGGRDKLMEDIASYSCGMSYSDNRIIILDFTGTTAQCESLLEIFSRYKILEISRTGITALSVTSNL